MFGGKGVASGVGLQRRWGWEPEAQRRAGRWPRSESLGHASAQP